MNIVFLTGLPRSGSTLLCSILGQNPRIKTGRISNLCDLMWNAQVSLNGYADSSGLQAKNHKLIMSKLPELYYSGIDNEVVVDQCRAWTLPANLKMITDYITISPKIICLTRDIDEVRESYLSLFERNGRNDFLASGYEHELFRNMIAVDNAKQLPEDWVHWVDYDELVEDTKMVIDGLYSFINQETYAHDLQNIFCDFSESESVSGLVGLHEVRKQIGRRDN